MPILGTRTYSPLPDSGFPRPYVKRVGFRFGAGAIITHSEGDFFITDGANPNVHVVCNLMPQVWDWSTAGYTLNFIVKDWYLLIDPDPTPQALPFGTGFEFRAADFSYRIMLGIIGWTTEYEFLLPDAPGDYWRNNP